MTGGSNLHITRSLWHTGNTTGNLTLPCPFHGADLNINDESAIDWLVPFILLGIPVYEIDFRGNVLKCLLLRSNTPIASLK